MQILSQNAKSEAQFFAEKNYHLFFIKTALRIWEKSRTEALSFAPNKNNQKHNIFAPPKHHPIVFCLFSKTSDERQPCFLFLFFFLRAVGQWSLFLRGIPQTFSSINPSFQITGPLSTGPLIHHANCTSHRSPCAVWKYIETKASAHRCSPNNYTTR